MATTSGGRGILDKKNSSLMFIHITPPHGWKEDTHFHYLRLTLPGFETNNITIHLDKFGYLVVRGDRQVSEHKYISFEETFDIPDDANIEDANGQFEDDQVYCITIPKKQGQERTKKQQRGQQRTRHENKPMPIERTRSGDVHPKPHDRTRSGGGHSKPHDSLVIHPSHEKKWSIYGCIISCCRRCGCL